MIVLPPGPGTVYRVKMNGTVPGTVTVIGSGFGAAGVPGAILAPAGLSYDDQCDTLYIVDSLSNRVIAFKHATQISDNGIVVNGNNFQGLIDVG